MKFLLSPAKTIQNNQAPFKLEYSSPIFSKESEYLVNKLKKYSANKLKILFDVSLEIAETNYHRFQNWTSSQNETNDLLACAYAFNGEVYRGLNVQEFNVNQIAYLNQNLRILSGLYGLLKPLDLIYPYRLEMGTKIQLTPKISSLYAFWDDKITKELNKLESEVLINLASTEYFKAVQTKKLKAKIITPIFKEFKNGEYKIVMTYAKHARGEMVNFATKNNILHAEDLKHFSALNYEYNDNLSNETDWIFVR